MNRLPDHAAGRRPYRQRHRAARRLRAELNSGFGGDSATLIKLGPASARAATASRWPRRDHRHHRADEEGRDGQRRQRHLARRRPASFELRPQLKIIEGRRFEPGLREIIVGAGVKRLFRVELDNIIRMRARTGRSSAPLKPATPTTASCGRTPARRSRPSTAYGFSAVRLGLESPAALETLKTALMAVRA